MVTGGVQSVLVTEKGVTSLTAPVVSRALALK